MVINYELIAQDPATGARAGLLHTPHGTFKTPMFMPVGTQATVKLWHRKSCTIVGSQVILSNTYHLFFASRSRAGAQGRRSAQVYEL